MDTSAFLAPLGKCVCLDIIFFYILHLDITFCTHSQFTSFFPSVLHSFTTAGIILLMHAFIQRYIHSFTEWQSVPDPMLHKT